MDRSAVARAARHEAPVNARLKALVLAFALPMGASCVSQSVGDTYKGLPPPLQVTRQTLAQGDIEEKGYGAYSYVLFSREPDGNPRYRALVDAWASIARDARASASTNVTYLPTLRHPAPEEARKVDWLVSNYDTSRAANLAFKHHLLGEGPFILTSTTPVTFTDGSEPVSVLDLSSATAQSMHGWMSYFIHASEGPNDWRRNGATSLVLRLHDELLAAGEAATWAVDALPNGTKVLRYLGLGR